MSIQYFNLYDGSLEFTGDKLIIFDNAKRNRNIFIISVTSSLIYSITTIINGHRRNDNDFFWFGVGLTVIWILLLIFKGKEFHKVENEILLSNVNKVKFSIDRFDGNIIAKILYKNNSLRKIKIVKEENQDRYFKALLNEHKINIE